MRRPSVLFINRVYPPLRGATGRVLRDLARAFAREGWQVTVLASAPRPAREKDGSIRVLRLPGRRKPSGFIGYSWLWLRLLIAALRIPRTDLVITLSDPPMLIVAGQIIKKLKKNRHIHWCHDLYPDLFPALDVRLPGFLIKLLESLARRAMEDCDKIVAVGRCMARSIAIKGIDPRQISFIPNWPDAELVRPPRDAAPGARPTPETNGAKPYEEQIKDESPKFRVLYAGNIGRAHPVKTLLDAAAILDATNPEIEFVFVGDGPKFDFIARERTRRGLHNIRLMPFQPQSRLREVMESGDVHLVSVSDLAAGMMVPCKLYSGLAAGRPCIYVGPPHTEMAKVITDFKAGSVARHGKAEDLASIILNYRMSSDDWFTAHEGAMAAANIFIPKDAIEAWLSRAWSVVELDLK